MKSTCGSGATIRRRTASSLGEYTVEPSRSTGSWTCRADKVPRRHAGVAAQVRPRRVRLRRDAHQRPQSPGVQDAPSDEGQDHRRAAGGPARAQGTRRRHGSVLRQVPIGHAVPGQRRGADVGRAVADRRRSVRASTTRPSASCARRAPPAVPASGPTTPTSGRRRSCRRTVSSSTAGTGAQGAWRLLNADPGCGAAAPSSTAPRPARARSRSPVDRRGEAGAAHRGCRVSRSNT